MKLFCHEKKYSTLYLKFQNEFFKSTFFWTDNFCYLKHGLNKIALTGGGRGKLRPSKNQKRGAKPPRPSWKVRNVNWRGSGAFTGICPFFFFTEKGALHPPETIDLYLSPLQLSPMRKGRQPLTHSFRTSFHYIWGSARPYRASKPPPHSLQS